MDTIRIGITSVDAIIALPFPGMPGQSSVCFFWLSYLWTSSESNGHVRFTLLRSKSIRVIEFTMTDAPCGIPGRLVACAIDLPGLLRAMTAASALCFLVLS